MKNLTARQLAFLASGGIAFLVLIVLLALRFAFTRTISAILLFIVPAVTFAGAYFLFFFLLEKFIYKKIWLIYEKVFGKKSSANSSDVISELEAEVARLANRQTREIEALQQLSQYRKEFLGNVSHELKTPIFNIQGYLHTLIDGGLDDQEINKRYLQKATENLERLGNIVQDLEIISQMETQAFTPDFTRFNIIELIEETLNDLEMKAEKKRIQLRFKEGTTGSVFVKADRESIRQVLTNLISNSIRYGKEGGETVVTIVENEKIAVAVADNGIGIAEEHLPRLFERFYRVDKSRSRELGGTGLGLSIVKHIVEAHGQDISVRSVPGEGSVFEFTLKKA